LAVFNPIYGSAEYLKSIVLPDLVTHATIAGSNVYVASPPSQIGILRVDPESGAIGEQRWYDVPIERRGLSSEIGGIAWDRRQNKVYIATRGEDPALYVDTWTGSGAIHRRAELRDLQVHALAMAGDGESLYALSGNQLVELDFSGRTISTKQLTVEPLEDVDLVVTEDRLALIGAFRCLEHRTRPPSRRECVFLDKETGRIREMTFCGPPADLLFEYPKKAAEPVVTGVGSLLILTRPAAAVWLNGKSVGDTPMAMQLTAGEHSVVLRAKGKTVTKAVTIRPGRKTSVNHLF
jgi:hypothetical protein